MSRFAQIRKYANGTGNGVRFLARLWVRGAHRIEMLHRNRLRVVQLVVRQKAGLAEISHNHHWVTPGGR